MKYEKIMVEVLEKEIIKQTNDDGTITFIPIDSANSDYQTYLRWIENPDAEAEHLNGSVDGKAL